MRSPGVGYGGPILSGAAARQANLARKYGHYRKTGLKHGQALARS